MVILDILWNSLTGPILKAMKSKEFHWIAQIYQARASCMWDIWVFVIDVLFQGEISAHQNQVHWKKKRIPIRTDLTILYEWLRNGDHKKEVVMQSQWSPQEGLLKLLTVRRSTF